MSAVLQKLAARPHSPTYSSNITLHSVQHNSSTNEQSLTTYVASLGLWLLGCAQNLAKAKPFRSPSKLWGPWDDLFLHVTPRIGCSQDHASMISLKREGEGVAVSDFWWFSVDLMQEQSVKWLEASPSLLLLGRGYFHLSTVQTKVETDSNNHSLAKFPILMVSTKWVLKAVTRVRKRHSKLARPQSRPYFHLF